MFISMCNLLKNVHCMLFSDQLQNQNVFYNLDDRRNDSYKDIVGGRTGIILSLNDAVPQSEVDGNLCKCLWLTQLPWNIYPC